MSFFELFIAKSNDRCTHVFKNPKLRHVNFDNTEQVRLTVVITKMSNFTNKPRLPRNHDDDLGRVNSIFHTSITRDCFLKFNPATPKSRQIIWDIRTAHVGSWYDCTYPGWFPGPGPWGGIPGWTWGALLGSGSPLFPRIIRRRFISFVHCAIISEEGR